LTISGNDLTTPTTAVGLTGTGTALFTLSPAGTLDFGTAARGSTSKAQIVTVTNTSGGTLNNLQISLGSGRNPEYATTTTCRNTLAAGATCAVSVVFAPTTRNGVGTKTDTLRVTGGGFNGLTVTDALTGIAN
jgi:hypothetical protein